MVGTAWRPFAAAGCVLLLASCSKRSTSLTGVADAGETSAPVARVELAPFVSTLAELARNPKAGKPTKVTKNDDDDSMRVTSYTFENLLDGGVVASLPPTLDVSTTSPTAWSWYGITADAPERFGTVKLLYEKQVPVFLKRYYAIKDGPLAGEFLEATIWNPQKDKLAPWDGGGTVRAVDYEVMTADWTAAHKELADFQRWLLDHPNPEQR